MTSSPNTIVHFYCYNQLKKIVASDHPSKKVKDKFGYQFEILNSVSKESYSVVMERIKRSYPNMEFIEWMFKPRVVSKETGLKISLSKRNKPRDEATKKKISETMKGKSNFQGKKHKPSTKMAMALKAMGNDRVKDKKWIYSPELDKEYRISDNKVPEGFIQGRDYDSIADMKYAYSVMVENRRRD